MAASGAAGRPSARPSLQRRPRIATKANAVERLRAAHLYVITPDAPPQRVLDIAAAAVNGGADIVQLRHKSLGRGELLTLARGVREITRRASVIFIVNDHVDIALLSEADGVHLGPGDLSTGAARRVAGDRLLIGASASTVEAALACLGAGADYLGSGPAFVTPIKSEKSVIGPRGVVAITQAAGPAVPVFAIGGIDESNLAQLTAEGLTRACVIRAVADAADPAAATRRLRAMLTSV